MAHNEKPATGAGLPIVLLSGEDRTVRSETHSKTQGSRTALLFNPRTRDGAIHTANELNAAASRCRKEARLHPGATGATLDKLAGHYAGMARDWFFRAETLPATGGAR